MTFSSPSLVAQGLIKMYGHRTVVDHIDLQVKPNAVTGLLGPNGAGKTTTFKMLLGLVQPNGGTVSFNEPLDGLPLFRRARLGIGYLPQGPSVFGGLKVKDNLLAILETLKKPNPQQKTDALLEKFGLTNVQNQKASTLSGGERRKLEFARALCSDPKILLVDEPFAGVDPIAVSDISKTIKGLSQDGVGILLTDHTVREALQVCDYIYLIVEGRILEHGTPDQIKTSAAAKRLYLGESF